MLSERWSSLCWLAFAVAICVGSLRMGIGSLGNPGMGLIPFGASVLLGIFAVILFLQSMVHKREETIGSLFTGRLWNRAVVVLIALLLYAKLIAFLGYPIGTFLLMTVLYWIVRGQRWYWVLGSAFLTTIASYYLFSKILNCQFPPGILGI